MEPLASLNLDQFPEMSDELKAFILEREAQHNQHHHFCSERIEAMKAELLLLKRFRYGSRSERKKKV